jgi:hypothetical protein
MNRKASDAASVFLIVVLLIISLFGVLNVTSADPMPPNNGPVITIPPMTSIYIYDDGSVTPGAPIVQDGNLYILTGDITGNSLAIARNNIVFDGEGHTIQSDTSGPPLNYSPSTGITVSAENVTVENVNVYRYELSGIAVHGDHNLITDCTLEPPFTGGMEIGIDLEGNYNNVTANSLQNCDITLAGSYNIIERNMIIGNGIYMASSIIGEIGPSPLIPPSPIGLTPAPPPPITLIVPPTGPYTLLPSGPTPENNIIAGNTMRDCFRNVYAIYLSTGNNVFYLNNFINNTSGNVSPYGWELFLDGKQISMNQWTPKAYLVSVYSNDTLFDNGKLGNYWSDYNGTDRNHDGIGDKPYVIGGILQDNYPRMSPVDIANVNIPAYHWATPSSQASLTTPSPTPTTPGIRNIRNSTQNQTQNMLIMVAITGATLIAGVIAFTVLTRKKQK